MVYFTLNGTARVTRGMATLYSVLGDLRCNDICEHAISHNLFCKGKVTS